MNSPTLKRVVSKPKTRSATLIKPVPPVVVPMETRASKALGSADVTAAEPAETAVISIETRRRRGNRRSEQTVDNILMATEEVILKSGADRISILEVCNTAGVSRGTFYRYFASQEELLDAFSRHRRENFHKSLTEALTPCTDPDQRFATMVEFVDAYLASGRSRRMLLVAPEFALKFFKRIFHDAVVRFQDLLGPVFDAWDERLDSKLDRELICELIVRFMLSEHLIGDDSDRRAMPRRIARLVESLRRGGGGLARR
ncbi:TetR/AcrR family transcriptional regulator [Polaromonas sp.]|uniref:TetR/AcrR family transcriptional regulator n=1 Tax=Polaromonas sp. TaxID=1869339 RepID=UPI0025E4EA83|nr:TetR/AcrR family transcriptional regulator [Polaromonas sp.]